MKSVSSDRARRGNVLGHILFVLQESLCHVDVCDFGLGERLGTFV